MECKNCKRRVYDRHGTNSLCYDCRPKKVEHYDATEHIIEIADLANFILKDDSPPPDNTGLLGSIADSIGDLFTGDGGGFSGGGSSGSWDD